MKIPTKWLAMGLLATISSSAMSGNVDILFLDSFEAGCGNLIYSEPFTYADASAWPAPWSVLGNVASADIQQNAARVQPMPVGYSLARMGAPITTRNVEARFTFRFEDATTQGVGFYVRQNGGYLKNMMPHGQGYAAFAEGSFKGTPGIGVWKELGGKEIQLDHQSPHPMIVANLDYRVRFMVLQSSSTETLVRAKMWPDGDVEPAAWQATTSDATSELQNVSGDIAIDSWSVIQSPNPITTHTFVDNVELISVCVP